MSRRFHWIVPLVASLLLPLVSSAAAPEGDLRTVAERTDYRATARYGETVELARRLAAASPRVRLSSIGTSGEGRDLALLVVSDPPVKTAAEARRSGKPVVLAFGGIHSGEACGKAAILALAREVGTTPGHPFAKDLVLALVPLLNPDGAERVSPEHRPGQVGPEEGRGARPNAAGLDLNRDWVKLEAPETRAVVRFLREWDPLLVIDTHTTDGSWHRYPITWAGPKHPAGDRRLIAYVRDEMMPRVAETLREEKGLRIFPYGNFAGDHTRWETYPAGPRYGTPYRGLRGRFAILTEAYAYTTFRERVEATGELVRALLDHLVAHREEMVRIAREADERAERAGREPRPEDRIALRTRLAAAPEKATVLGYVEKIEAGERVRTEESAEYEVELRDRFEPVVAVERPFAYLLPARLRAVAAKLREHGVRIERLREDLDLDVEVWRIETLQRDEKPFQGHRLVRAEATRRRERRRVEAGTLVVRSAQRLGNLAAFLLEPLAEDGLTTWSFFDEELKPATDFPVLRLPEPAPLLTAREPERAAAPGERRKIDFEAAYGSGGERPRLSGSPMPAVTWLADGEHWITVRDGKPWKVGALTGRAEPALDAEALEKGLGRLEAIGEATARAWARSTRPHVNRDRTAALFEHAGDLWYAALDGSEARRLTHSPEKEELAEFSPDGRFVAFVRENDLWVVAVKSGTERALTTGGSDTLRNGKACWVYFEEIFDRSWKAWWWSPDSRHIAFLRTDSSGVPVFTLIDDRPHEQRVERSTYPRPGEDNPRVEIGIVGVAGGEPKWVDLSRWSPGDLVVSGARWSASGSHLWFYAQDRTQSWLDFARATPSGGEPEVLWRDRTGKWIEDPPAQRFLEKGGFLLVSDRDGWAHLYLYDEAGRLVRRLTEGRWEVRGVEAVDEESGTVWFTATRESPIAENLYRVGLDGSGLERLTQGEGWHRVRVAPRGRYFVDAVSSHRQPPRVTLHRGSGELVRRLDTNPVGDLERWTVCPVEPEEIRARDGHLLHAMLVRPPDFDPEKRYPVWFMTYGGPHMPSVRDTWSGGRLWDQVLAQSGIVAFHCDPRTASAEGSESAWAAYRKLGVQELEDIRDAIGWLRGHAWVDADRIGMSGYSYGGFMTSFAMTHSDLFAAGIAGGPVTDWRLYDSIYTERYMSTPQENPDGYRESSVIEAAGNLHGRLLLVFGAIDDNVHPQNTIRLAEALQRAGKQFDLMLYPGYRHGIWARHFSRLKYDFIQRTIGSGCRQKEKAREGEEVPADREPKATPASP